MLHASADLTLRSFVAEGRTCTFERDDIRYHYVGWRLEQWDATKPLVVCVHGYKNNLHSFADLIPRLGLPAISIDLRGYGQTLSPVRAHVSFPDYLTDLKRFIDHVGAREVILVGHSMGARASAAWTAVFPETVRTLVMIEGFYFLYEPGRWHERMRRYLEQVDREPEPLPRLTLERLERFYQRQTPGMAPAFVAHLARFSHRVDSAGTLVPDWAEWHNRPSPYPFNDHSMQDALRRIQRPTLVLQATTAPDWGVELAVRTPYLEIRRVQGGHQLHWERPVELAAQILEFIRGQGVSPEADSPSEAR